MSASEQHADPLEQAIADLRELADRAEADLESRKEETDMEGVNPKQMAVAEMQGMMKAYQQSWRAAISNRPERPEEDDG